MLLELALCDIGELAKQYNIEEMHAKPLIYDILSGIREIHNRTIVHIDLKPNNLLLHPSGKVLITDFGFSKKIDPTKSLQICSGTPGVSII
jgi:serine/threonine protein kinase